MEVNEYESDNKSPFIGVHVKWSVINLLKEQKVDRNIDRLQKMNNIAKTNLYFFSERDVKYNKKKIKGVYYNTKTSKWTVAEFPFPDVYYNRRGESKDDKDVQKVRETIEKMSITKINSNHFYNKWYSHQELYKYEEIRPHLPETILYKNESDIVNMLKDTSSLYLKSFRQNNGKGIIRVTKKTNCYEYKYFIKKRLMEGTASTLEELIQIIHSFYAGNEFIVQKSIDLLQYKHSTLDLRCDVQRNGKGELECVSHAVRVSAKNSHVTNTKTKSSIYPFEEFFREKLGFSDKEIRSLKTRLERLLFNIFEKLELTYGSYGEMGIDIGIDKEGSLLLFECNIKPGKKSLWACDEQTIDRAFLNPLEYAKFLSSSQPERSN
ncbi:YheC/YheD family protein [Bacillus rhizoplanae]|uniref:YheC/YheD family endospore coat-associated protein n=1 Tax=Bacillus rhizoplanae TaxID=2880966 RepID=UPI003D233F05